MSYFIGVMSGTSLDGIDVALVENTPDSDCHLIAAQTYDFDPELKQGLKILIEDQHCELKKFGELDVALGKAIASAVIKLIKTTNIDIHDIVAIGSHGQTVFHHPDGPHPFSLQIGNANVIAELTTITTVADFRQRDMVLSGQGAPLVPAFHKALFQHPSQNRVIINIGGISNITVLPASNSDKIIGFDTGPGNTLLDAWFEKHQHAPYDHDGLWAASGSVNRDLLRLLVNDPYFQQAIPKSTGREYFNVTWLDNKLREFKQQLAPQDIQATLTALTAQTIAHDVKRYAPMTDAIYICGGGAHNSYLMKALRQLLAHIPVTTTEQLGLDPDWVEACAFAWLARQSVSNKAGNLPEVTGAKRATILGGIYSSNDAS